MIICCLLNLYKKNQQYRASEKQPAFCNNLKFYETYYHVKQLSWKKFCQ